MMKAVCFLAVELLIPWVLLTDAHIFTREKTRENVPELLESKSYLSQLIRSRLGSMRTRRDADLKPDVTEFDLKNDTTHNQALIHWSGNNSKVVFILTRKKSSSVSSRITESTLWRSTNYGKNYKLMTSAFSSNAILKSYFISPSNKQRVIFVDTFNHSSRIWISEDEGETYGSVIVPFSVEKIDFHPENSSMLLGYDKFRRELFCSMDFGKTWKRLGEEVTSERYFWYVKGVDVGKDAQKIVHFEYRQISITVSKKIIKVKSCYVPDCKSTAFQSQLNVLENIDMDSLTVQNRYVFVQKSGAADKLYVSYKRGPFFKAIFPYYEGQAQAHFHIISSDGDCVMVGVNHDKGLTHLFVSDLEGKKFTETLSHVRYFNKKTTDNKVFNVDVYEAQGVIGTYVANKHSPTGYNTTYITWDNGQFWSRITGNVTDENGNDLGGTCDNNCSLNLHLSMEQTKSGYFMQSVLAKKSFPGLIIAHGTYGRTVEDNPNAVNLFISRDNGRSWRIAKRQRHFVVVANRGTVIVAVKMIFLKPVNELVFSSNYGVTWTPYKFSDVTVNVDGILTEPGESTPHLTLFGHHSYAESWKIFQINMTGVFPNNCSYPDDFEEVTLPTHIQDCHLGMKQKVTRLKIDRHCFVKSTQLNSSKTVCKCTRKDYQCDGGYIHHGPDECVRKRTGLIDSVGELFPEDAVYAKAKCDGNGKRNVSSGLRRIPGDVCQNDLADIFWKLEDCNKQPTTTPTPKPNVSIKLLNETKSAKVGDNLIFSIQGTADDTVVWHVLPLMNKGAEKKIKENTKFTLVSQEPGPYKVRAELQGTLATSDWILVKFWYPIEKVYLYHPPVVALSESYNATAWTQTVYGLRGNVTLLGDVQYTWDVETQDESASVTFSEENVFRGKARKKASSVQIRVTAENTVSLQSTSGRMRVKEFIVHLVLEMYCIPPMKSSDMTDLWLIEFKEALVNQLFRMEPFMNVKEKYELLNEINLFVYVPPGNALRVFIYLAPMHSDDTKDRLFQAAKAIEKVIVDNGLSVLLANHHIAAVQNHYIVDYNGVRHDYQSSTGPNGGVVAIAVILVIILIVAAFFVARHFLKKTRFDRYLHFHNMRSSGGGSHIVRNHDRSPIVEEEFIDDDLNTMEDLGGTDATLQFQG